MFPKAKRGTSSWHVQLRLLSKGFAVATIPRTLAEQNYSACAFPMGLSALSAAAWNTNAQKFETAFYAKPDLRNVRPPEEPAKSEPATLDLESLVEQLQKSPELASALAALIAAQAPAK